MVFEAANDLIDDRCYDIHILSVAGGLVSSSSAVVLSTRSIVELAPECIDTLLIAGGEAAGLDALIADPRARDWAVAGSKAARRYGSVCTGTFALAGYGLIGTRHVTTHWSACERLARQLPNAKINRDAVFVNDGRLWTSAGVTSGIDMCVEMVAQDLGVSVAHRIAKRLVLAERRPSHQRQLSPVLRAQFEADAPFAELIEHIQNDLSACLSVTRLAQHAAMSERTFHRRFTQSIGMSPARFVQIARLEHVRKLLATDSSLKEIASRTGFSGSASLSSAFKRCFGLSPERFRASLKHR
ncbi:GlxA family transcriptional regulator [Salinisphaera sp. Q1T1-3]|uniref:GlxA family transcriptional regulator n=1 Tax=Salinisphaera sp. Q1T1-3 TaxID=2321229 RepID=UPI001F43071B|nr:helix-turn-helix domain-containing protein [Salinisphaera sp. Q1T1-3]